MNTYGIAADAVLVTHTLFVTFVVAGQALILAGLARGWRWVRNFSFRIAHLAAIGIVVAQAWLGVLCPLTVFENSLRRRAGEAAYSESFIGYWLHRVIYYDVEPWVFTALYTAFAAVVVLTWVYGRPVRTTSTNRSPPSRAERPQPPRR